jgi:hypothetical protein
MGVKLHLMLREEHRSRVVLRRRIGGKKNEVRGD